VVDLAGTRLDRAVVARVPEISRAQVQRLIKTGSVLVNGQPSKASYQTQTGDEVSVFVPDDAEEPVLPEALPLDIVFEDPHIIVVNKASGMVVHPALGHSSGTLVNALLAHCPEIANVGGLERAGVVHRLDRDTSGLLVVAKDDEIRQALQRQFKRRQVDKVYTALVEGRLSPREGIVDAPIGRDRAERKRMAVVRSGREARTHYQVSEYLGEHTLVEVRPRTGRTHQIRVHLAWIGHPLVGDSVYGSRRQRLLADRHFLHATRLGFVHPATSGEVEFEAPLPQQLDRLLAKLRTRR
jgi:23S rRNA pseudouridine1911/1915/1917 synthase